MKCLPLAMASSAGGILHCCRVLDQAAAGSVEKAKVRIRQCVWDSPGKVMSHSLIDLVFKDDCHLDTTR